MPNNPPSKTFSEIEKSIRDQSNQLRSRMETPCSVYLNLHDAGELMTNGESYKTSTALIYGLKIVVHDDFPDPVVRAGSHVR